MTDFISPIRLGVNVDHVATLRNARGGTHPDILRACQICAEAGADSITVHLREDRRHIRDDDVRLLRHELMLPMNLEMALTPEMVDLALDIKPHAVCLVPEKRTELTTEGGLDMRQITDAMARQILLMQQAGINVCAFVEPSVEQINAAHSNYVRIVELHTGRYSHCRANDQMAILEQIRQCADYALSKSMACHAGHGLNYQNVTGIAAIAAITELNIGHFLIGEAVFSGLATAIRHMRFLMNQARASAA